MQTRTTRHAPLNGHPAETLETGYSKLFVAPTGLIAEDDDLEDDDDLDLVETDAVETPDTDPDIEALDDDDLLLEEDDDEDEDDDL
jgi:hypothetical protein